MFNAPQTEMTFALFCTEPYRLSIDLSPIRENTDIDFFNAWQNYLTTNFDFWAMFFLRKMM